eukprot:1649216-Amphidinium_carterae.2
MRTTSTLRNQKVPNPTQRQRGGKKEKLFFQVPTLKKSAARPDQGRHRMVGWGVALPPALPGGG